MEMQILLALILCVGILNTKAAPTTSSLVLQGIEPHQNKTIFKYDIQVKVENGQTLHEKLVINTKAKTELFSVPKHGDKEEIEVLEDYSKNLTAIHIKAKNICYVSKMISTALPDEFKADLDNVTMRIVEDNDTNVKVETTTWKVDAVLAHRNLLSKEMAVMCARSSIYWIQRIDGTGSVRQSRDTDHLRVRRSPCKTTKVCVPIWKLRIVIINGKKKLKFYRALRCITSSC